MRHASVLSGAPFRTALLALAVFVPCLALIGATLHRSLGAAMLGELEAQVIAELVLLREIAGESGEGALVDAVHRMEQSGASGARLTALFDETGARLAGDIDAVPRFVGWRTLEVTRRLEHESGPYRARVERWRHTTVMVGRSTRLVERAQARLVRDLAAAGSLVTALCLLIGYVASRATRDKLERMAETLDRVSLGETRARLPIGRTNDQIDRVSRQINGHLERLSTLMESLRNTAGAIAHDLRTPLARASLKLQEVLVDESLDARDVELLEGVAGELEELGEIVETVLRIARIEAADDGRDFRTFPLARLVEEIGDVFLPVAEERGQTLETRSIDEEVLRPAPSTGSGGPVAPAGSAGRLVRGDERMLRRMLANLVENAIRHCPEGTRIRLSSGPGRQGGAALLVEDDGPGIPPEERGRVLEPFVRLDASRTTAGTGLGLALVGAVARRHGARVALEDAAPGLRVVVDFPAAVTSP